jgi:hypothetical protein
VHGEDVGVLEAGGEPDLALEALGAKRLGQLGMEYLERDGAVVAEVLCEVHRGHAAAAELTLEEVTVAQDLCESGRRVAHVESGLEEITNLRAQCCDCQREDRIDRIGRSGYRRASLTSGVAWNGE